MDKPPSYRRSTSKVSGMVTGYNDNMINLIFQISQMSKLLQAFIQMTSHGENPIARQVAYLHEYVGTRAKNQLISCNSGFRVCLVVSLSRA